MNKLVDKLTAKVAEKPKIAALALLVTSIGWGISGAIVMLR